MLKRWTVLLLTLIAPAIVANEAPPIDEPQSFQIERRGTFNGKTIEYTATASDTYLINDDGEPTATIFSIAYVKKDVDDASRRPVTFLWNGGPGSCSVWLHMGAFGPQRVVVPSDAKDDGAPPFR